MNENQLVENQHSALEEEKRNDQFWSKFGFIEQAFRARHEFWRYLIGALCVFIASTIGQIPLMIAIIAKEGFSIAGKDQAYMMNVLDKNLTLFLLLFSFLVGLLALFLIVRTLHNQKIKGVTTSRKKVDWGRIFFGFSLIAVFTIVVTGYDYYVNPQDYEVTFQWAPFLVLFLIAVVFIPIQTSMEEYLFRGYLMQGFGMLAKNRWLPLVMTSVIFGGMHFFNPEVGKLGNIIMLYYIGTGFFLGIITLMDEGMELALGFHAGNNLVGALLVTADWTAFQTHSILKDISDPSAGFDVLLPVLIIYPIFLFLMAKKYNWKNWNEKLFGKVRAPKESGLADFQRNEI